MPSSNPHNQTSCRSPGTNDDKKERESTFNDVNGSFDGQETNILPELDNAEQKLANLAAQLGESCLTNDLAALMSQKRDLELVESARKIVQKPHLTRQWTIAQNLEKKRSISSNNTV